MINLLYESLPNSIAVRDKDFLINTDFKYWIELSDALNDPNCNKEYLANVIMNIFYDEIPEKFNQEVFLAIKDFLIGNVDNKKEQLSTNNNLSSKKRIYDYKIDSDYFIAAFQQHYQINLLKENMHWYHFLALFHGLGDCELKQRMYYRGLDLSSISDKKERSRIRKIQQQLSLDKAEINDEMIAQVLW